MLTAALRTDHSELSLHRCIMDTRSLARGLDDLNAAFGVLCNMYCVLVAFSKKGTSHILAKAGRNRGERLRAIFTETGFAIVRSRKASHYRLEYTSL